MGTTTNNGWPTPVATDLVKDGWEAIKDLGDAIDTTLGVYVASSAGLVKLNTQTFTTASTISFPNDTFTSTYNDYFFTFDLVGSTALDLTARVRASGTDNSAANYSRTSWEAAITGNTSTGQTSMLLGSFYDSDQKRSLQNFSIKDVQVSGRYTSGLSFSISNLDSGTYAIQRFHAVNVTTSYDSISFITSTGTVTGSITCYGYVQ